VFCRSFPKFNIYGEFLQLQQKICLNQEFFGHFLLTGPQKQFIIGVGLPMNTIAACPVLNKAALMVFQWDRLEAGLFGLAKSAGYPPRQMKLL
jgi:hypothetical protein